MKIILLNVFLLCTYFSFAQKFTSPEAAHWADSVFNTLNNDERIAQLMILRLSEKKGNEVVFYDKKIEEAIRKYNIGGICLFQGGPVKQAEFVNHFQSLAKTPIMVCVDAEWGLGMRFDSIIPLNHQLMLGALQDTSIIYQYGHIVGEQCRRAGITINYAPVVDINNNPDNPVINDRSFGEDKYKVASFGIQYMKGMQDAGVLACAKHFPGHGDVSVDSHLALPVINKTKAQLDSLELFPFREIFKAGVGSVMIAHLYIPAIDKTANRATSISKNNVTGLLRNELGYNGLTFTDALEMKGVSKFFPGGEISAQSLIAGNDMLCLPADVPASIAKIKQAIKSKKLSWEDVYRKCKKVLAIKYLYGLNNFIPVDTNNLVIDLNSKVNNMRKNVAENAITLLNKDDDKFFPLSKDAKTNNNKKVAYMAIGISTDNFFAKRMKADYNADVFYFDYKKDSAKILSTIDNIRRYSSVVIGIHNYARYPANNFGISKSVIALIKQLQSQSNSITFVFGNPYAIKNFCDAKNIVACYEDDDIIQNAAIDFLEGKISAKGKLPVTVCDKYKYGSGIVAENIIPIAEPADVGLNLSILGNIDSITNYAIEEKATPGCVVLVARNGRIGYYKAFGHYDYNITSDRVTIHSVYDLASVTKVCATTLGVMKLFEEGKLDLKKSLGDYLPWVKGSNKENLLIVNLLLHQAGLQAWIPFYKETLESDSIKPLPAIYSSVQNNTFNTRVAQNLFIRNDWIDTMYKRILQSNLGPADKYVYSDNDFIFLGKVVEAISGLSLDSFVEKNFYEPLGLTSICFKPQNKIDSNIIAPTENETYFRQQHLHGDVHDPGAAMFGGVSGHAGLFSNAYDLAVIMQMLLNGGSLNGRKYFNPETINLFTAYNSTISRRGFGFDKPDQNNAESLEPYPCLSASPLTFGHTGFTGTCVWADPKYNLIFIFLSNRVNPDGGHNSKLSTLNIRGRIQETIYQALIDK